VSSKKGLRHTVGIAYVSEGAVVVADSVWEPKPLPVWVTELLPSYGEEQEAPKVEENIDPSSTGVKPSDHEESVDPPIDEDTRPRWLRDTLRDTERHAAPRNTFRESRPPQRFLSYVALMSSIIDSEPSSFEEATGH
jgi:hypothetical protein